MYTTMVDKKCFFGVKSEIDFIIVVINWQKAFFIRHIAVYSRHKAQRKLFYLCCFNMYNIFLYVQ